MVRLFFFFLLVGGADNMESLRMIVSFLVWVGVARLSRMLLRSAVGFFPFSLFSKILITKLLSMRKFKGCVWWRGGGVRNSKGSKGRQVGLG